MKAATISELRKELKHNSKEELYEYCLAMARFKLESKELLTYLVFESEDEATYIESVKSYIDNEFEAINTASYHYIKKSIRRTLREVKKFSRYSPVKTTEVELLLYFCECLVNFKPTITKNRVLMNIFERETFRIWQLSKKLHEDLQHDYLAELELIKKQLQNE